MRAGKDKRFKIGKRLYALVICLAALSLFIPVLAREGLAAGDGSQQTARAPLTPIPSRSGPGYLAPDRTPEGFLFVPPPPGPGSMALALDEELNRKSLTLHGTPRWDLAAKDADLSYPGGARAFACTLNMPIDRQATPRLCALLFRTLADVSRSTRALKRHYNRPRPFMINKKPICTPEFKTQLEGNGSYPSGHAAAGWAWALVLSEIVPDKAEEILARGRAFGESRVVCNVHWYSDIVEGRLLASATVARLHDDPDFRADMEAAKAEVTRVRAKGLNAAKACTEESKALAIGMPSP